jgi:hypothetical protein
MFKAKIYEDTDKQYEQYGFVEGDSYDEIMNKINSYYGDDILELTFHFLEENYLFLIPKELYETIANGDETYG